MPLKCVKDHVFRIGFSDRMTELVYIVEERQHAGNSSLPCLFSNEDEHGSKKINKKGKIKRKKRGSDKRQ